MEDMDKASQVSLLSRTTILVGVHGNGLSGQLWLEPSPRATIIELFFENGFAYDYEYTARSLGLKHYGFWNDRYAIPMLCERDANTSPAISLHQTYPLVSALHAEMDSILKPTSELSKRVP
jgi:hypothetical protein